MSNILLSICVPVYNRSDRIKKILQQLTTFKSEEIEFVISDNASPDNTQEVISRFKDPRISYYRNKSNVGMDANFLLAIKRAKGKFIFLLMDEDDVELSTLPWILEQIRENNNLSQLCGSIGDKRPRYKGDYAGALKVTREIPQSFESILTKRYLFNKNYSRSDVRFEFPNKLFKKGEESLKELLFYYPHGSGIVLRKDVLDFKMAKDYIGITNIQIIFVGQALIAGDTISTSEIFASFGKDQFESRQDLFKGKDWWHPLNLLNQIRFRIYFIYDLVRIYNGSKSLRKLLLRKQYKEIYYKLFLLLFSKNYRNFACLSSDFEVKEIYNNLIPLLKSLKPFFEGIQIVLRMKRPFSILKNLLVTILLDAIKALIK